MLFKLKILVDYLTMCVEDFLALSVEEFLSMSVEEFLSMSVEEFLSMQVEEFLASNGIPRGAFAPKNLSIFFQKKITLA